MIRSSRKLALLGLNIGYLIRPIYIKVEEQGKTKTVIVRRKNWHFVSSDETVLKARTLNSVTVDKHLFGATFKYKAWGSKAELKYLRKRDADTIKNILIGE